MNHTCPSCKPARPSVVFFPLTGQLDPVDLKRAEDIGLSRWHQSVVELGRPETHGSSREGAQDRARFGAPAEAFCADRGVHEPWNGKGEMHWPDVSFDIEVRHSINGPSLIVRDNDNNDSFFFFVQGDPRVRLTIHGWMRGSMAKAFPLQTKGTMREPAHFVPISQLTKHWTVRPYPDLAKLSAYLNALKPKS
jgi:hypothetical protein